MVERCCDRKKVRMSLFEALEGDLEAAETKERRNFEAAEEGRKRQEYIVNYVHNEFDVDPEQLLPLDEVTARIGAIMPRVEAGRASEEDEAELTRLIKLLDANPEAKQQEEEARKAFLTEQESANASAARHLRSFSPPNARLLPSITALEAAGVGTSAARRLLRNNALLLVLTPPEEIASMHWVDMRKCSSLGLSLFELRAVVASLPGNISTDTAKGEKREWAKGLVEGLRSMVEKEAKGELQLKDLCHSCFGTASVGPSGDESSNFGPFNPTLPLTRRPTAVRSEPVSRAAEAQAAAALSATSKSIAERSAAITTAGRREEPPFHPGDTNVRTTGISKSKRPREHHTSGSIAAASREGGTKAFLAEIMAAEAARRDIP